MKKPQRVIFTLEDGRDIFDMHNGAFTQWEEEDINALLENIQRFGMPCFTADFKHYDVNYESLHKRFPKADILRVKGVHFRNHYGRPILFKK